MYNHPMPLHLITGPAHSGKSDYLVDKFRQLLNESPVLLVPTGLDVQRWRRRLVEALGVLTFGKVETFGSFTRELYRRLDAGSPILSTGAVRLLVRHVIEENRESLGALKAAAGRGGFAATLTRVIGEMESRGLTPAGLRAAIASDPDSLLYGDDVQLLYQKYQERLAGLGFTDHHLAAGMTADRLFQAGAVSEVPILLAGFADLTPAEERLLHALSVRSDVYMTITFEPGDPRLTFAQQAVERMSALASSKMTMSRSETRADTEYRFLGAGGRRCEVELIGALIADKIRAGTPPASIGVVARDLGPYKHLVADVFATYHIPFTSTGHLPLRLTSLGRAVMLLLDCLSDRADQRANLTAFLRSPYSGASGQAVDEFDHLARRYGISDKAKLMDLIDETDVLPAGSIVRDILTRAPGNCLGLLDSLKEIVPRMWLNAHEGAGKGAGTTDQALRDTGAARLISEELAGIADFAQNTGVSIAITVISELLNDLRLDLSLSSGASAVTVTDATDCHAFSFREVYVMGLNQQEFPRLGEEDPFFNDSERRLLAKTTGALLPLGVNGPDRERYLFYQAITRAKETVYLCGRYCDADGRDEAASFYLQDIKAELEESGVAVQELIRRLGDATLPLELVPTDDELLRSLAAGYSDPAYRDIAKTAGVSAAIETAAARHEFREPALTNATTMVRLRAKQRFGATELETYLNCPFKWFVEMLIRPVSITPDSEPLLAGKLAHRILAAALPEALSGAEDVRTILERRIGAAVARLAEEHEDVVQARVLAACLAAMLTPFVEGELRRLSAADGFTPLLFEHSFGAGDEHEVRLSDDAVLVGRVDRVDRGPGDSAFVIDYKTGTVGSGTIGDFEKNNLLQGLLYSLAVQQALGYEPAGCGYYSLKNQRWKSLAVTDSATLLSMGRGCDAVSREQYDDALKSAVDMGLELIGRVRSGDISLSPRNNDVCAYCEKAVCRASQAKPEAAWS